MAVRVNLGMLRYRDAILDGLKAEGHRIIEVTDENDDELKNAITTNQIALHKAESEAIAIASDIIQPEFEKLKERKAKTKSERYQERKYALQQRYAMSVTPDLVLKDDSGWYLQLRLHYFLTLGREHLPRRDGQRARSQLDKGDGAVFLLDFNRGQLSASVHFLEKLGVLELLDGREISGSDQMLQQISDMAQANRWAIRAVLGLSINEADKPIAIAQKLLGKCGLRLTYLGRKGSRADRQRVYKYVAPTDGREEVFSAWQQRDEMIVSPVSTPLLSLVSTPGNEEIITTPLLDTGHQIGVLPPTQESWRAGQQVKAWFGMGRCWGEGSIESVEVNTSNCFKAVVKLVSGATLYIWNKQRLNARAYLRLLRRITSGARKGCLPKSRFWRLNELADTLRRPGTRTTLLRT